MDANTGTETSTVMGLRAPIDFWPIELEGANAWVDTKRVEKMATNFMMYSMILEFEVE